MTTWRIELGYEKPPITENRRIKPVTRWRIQKRIRQETYLRIKNAKIPRQVKIRAWIEWHVTDRRHRDEDNLFPLRKPIFDALQDPVPPNRDGKGGGPGAGVVPADDTRYMIKEEARIIGPDDPRNVGRRAIFLLIQPTEEVAA